MNKSYHTAFTVFFVGLSSCSENSGDKLSRRSSIADSPVNQIGGAQIVPQNADGLQAVLLPPSLDFDPAFAAITEASNGVLLPELIQNHAQKVLFTAAAHPGESVFYSHKPMSADLCPNAADSYTNPNPPTLAVFSSVTQSGGYHLCYSIQSGLNLAQSESPLYLSGEPDRRIKKSPTVLVMVGKDAEEYSQYLQSKTRATTPTQSAGAETNATQTVDSSDRAAIQKPMSDDTPTETVRVIEDLSTLDPDDPLLATEAVKQLIDVDLGVQFEVEGGVAYTTTQTQAILNITAPNAQKMSLSRDSECTSDAFEVLKEKKMVDLNLGEENHFSLRLQGADGVLSSTCYKLSVIQDKPSFLIEEGRLFASSKSLSISIESLGGFYFLSQDQIMCEEGVFAQAQAIPEDMSISYTAEGEEDGELTLWLKIFDQAEQSSEECVSAKIILDTTAPEFAGEFMFNESAANNLLTWPQLIENGSGFSHYIVDIGSEEGVFNLKEGLRIDSLAGYQDLFSREGLAFAQDYFFRIQVFDLAGNSSEVSVGPFSAIELCPAELPQELMVASEIGWEPVEFVQEGSSVNAVCMKPRYFAHLEFDMRLPAGITATKCEGGRWTVPANLNNHTRCQYYKKGTDQPAQLPRVVLLTPSHPSNPTFNYSYWLHFAGMVNSSVGGEPEPTDPMALVYDHETGYLRANQDYVDYFSVQEVLFSGKMANDPPFGRVYTDVRSGSAPEEGYNRWDLVVDTYTTEIERSKVENGQLVGEKVVTTQPRFCLRQRGGEVELKSGKEHTFLTPFFRLGDSRSGGSDFQDNTQTTPSLARMSLHYGCFGSMHPRLPELLKDYYVMRIEERPYYIDSINETFSFYHHAAGLTMSEAEWEALGKPSFWDNNHEHALWHVKVASDLEQTASQIIKPPDAVEFRFPVSPVSN